MEDKEVIKPSDLLARQMGANVQEGEATTAQAHPVTQTQEATEQTIERHPVKKKGNVQEGEGS